MSSHDVTRDRGSLKDVLGAVTARSLVVGVDSDRLFPLEQQVTLAEYLPHHLGGHDAHVMSSPYGHDAFLIADAEVGELIRQLLGA